MGNVPSVAAYGTWKSPLTAEMLADETVSFEDTAIDGEHIYWIESRPKDNGESVIVHLRPNNVMVDRIAAPYDVRSRVHEYGGGAMTIGHDTVYFSHAGDNRLYAQQGSADPVPLTRADSSLRYADLVVDDRRQRLIAIREDHRVENQVENSLVAIPFNDPGSIGQVLSAGHDFYMFPRLSPDGAYLAWIAWDYPSMPWDTTRLYAAEIGPDGSLGPPTLVAGGDDESIFQPEWSPDNHLYFVSDRSGWWNLYAWQDGKTRPITALHAEFGQAAWTFGQSTYGFINASEILATYTLNGYAKLVRIDVNTREMTHLPCPFAALSSVKVSGQRALLVAESDRSPAAIALFDCQSRRYRIVRRSSATVLDEEHISLPQPIEFPTEDGWTGRAIYYAPKNRDYIPPEGEVPPLIVVVHGGPTDQRMPVFHLGVQYWTTRGFAVVEVNYRGSTGYGRAYRNALRGQWGIADVDDVVNAALFLTRHGQADAHRLIIRGGSAGGYTTLAALAFRDVFRVGASYFGISDLRLMALKTHKFESHYLDSLIGTLPEDEARYRERSPLFSTGTFNDPVVFFQGLDDHVVLPDQAEHMVNELTARGIPVAYLAFPGEGHGFLRAETLVRCQEAELYMYGKVLGIRLADRPEPLAIANWAE